MLAMLKHRLIFGSSMIAGLLLIFFLDNKLDQLMATDAQVRQLTGDGLPNGLLLLIVILAAIIPAAGELCTIFRAEDVDADRLMVTGAGMLGCVMLYTIPEDFSARNTIAVLTSVMIALFLLTLLKHSFRAKRTEGAIAAAAVVAFALIYMGLLPGFLLGIRRWYSSWVVLGVILIVKSCDIGAYFTGRAIGRHKLIEWLSPKKTWEGLAGGVLTSALAAMLLAWLNNQFHLAGLWTVGEGGQAVFMPHDFDEVRSFLAGGVMGLIGQFGDLVASLFKRDAGIKDSGSSIPGFGGMLDVVDSPIVVAPFAYWLLMIGAEMT